MIYVGHFLHRTNQEEIEEDNRRHGDFTLIVEADDQETAIEYFKDRLSYFKDNSDFFEGSCKIYFVQMLAFDQLPEKQPVMINYKSMAGDPIMPYISCSLPSEGADRCYVYNWNQNNPEIDGQGEGPFMVF